MNRALDHFCAHKGYIGPGEPPEDGEMSEMTLEWIRKKYFCFFQTAETENRTPNFSVKAAVLTTTL